MRGVWRWLGMITGALFVVALLGVPSWAEAREAHGSVVVRIEGLVGGAHGAIIVHGPGGFRRVLSRSQSLGGLRAGRYVLQTRSATLARAVKGVPRGSELLPTTPAIRVVVRPGKARLVRVRYGTIVRKGVRALGASPSQVLGPPGDPTALVVSSAASPRVGQILAQAPSNALPGGLFDVVTAVTPHGGSSTVSLRAAKLAEAFPELSLNATVELQPATQAQASSVFGPSLAHAADLPGVDFSLSRGRASCGVLTGSVAPRLHVALTLPLFGSPSAHVVLGATGNVSLDLGTSSGMSCSYTLDGPAFQGAVPIGPFLVPVYGTLQAVFSGSLSGPSIFNVGASLSLEGGLDYRNGETTPVLSASASGHATASLGCIAGTVAWLPTLEAGIGVKDPLAVNVHVDLGLGPELNIASGGWGVDDLLQLAAGASLGPITATLPALIQKHFATIATGTTTCGGSGGGSGGGSSGGGSSGGGGGEEGQKVAVGTFDSCALLASGQVDCWGDNLSGILGNETTEQSSVPVPVGGISTATQVAMGFTSACALLTSGHIDCWGEGQLGNGMTERSDTPIEAKGITNATQVGMSEGQACALLAGGQIACWGGNGYGGLGNGTFESSEVPVRVTGITTATQIAVGYDHSCALLASGHVDCWGINGKLGKGGELGIGTFTGPETCANEAACSNVPVQVSGLTNPVQITAGGNHACALLASGQIDCWGYNERGELGVGTTSDSNVPALVSGVATATQIAAGFSLSCARLASGHVDCWGIDQGGQLGNGQPHGAEACYNEEPCSRTPVQVSGLTTATEVAADEAHSCALLVGGHVDCWGYNPYGDLGDGTTTNSTIPVPVSGIR